MAYVVMAYMTMAANLAARPVLTPHCIRSHRSAPHGTVLCVLACTLAHSRTCTCVRSPARPITRSLHPSAGTYARAHTRTHAARMAWQAFFLMPEFTYHGPKSMAELRESTVCAVPQARTHARTCMHWRVPVPFPVSCARACPQHAHRTYIQLSTSYTLRAHLRTW